MISFLLAMGEGGVIGRNNQLPWHLPADLKYFKKVTMGHSVIMGRKTYESIGKSLPGRRNIVLTRDPSFVAEGCEIFHSPDEILVHLDQGEEAFIIGGAAVYDSFYPHADRLYITRIAHAFAGDTYFKYDPSEWRLVSDRPGVVDDQNRYPHRFQIFERVR